MRAVLQHFAPAERPGDRFDHGVVDALAYGRPCVGRASGARTSFLPPLLRIEMGMRTVTVRPSPVNVGSASNGLSRYKKGWGDTTAAFLWLPTSGIIEEPGIVPKEQELTVMGDRPPSSGPGGMLVESWPLRQRGRRSRST